MNWHSLLPYPQLTRPKPLPVRFLQGFVNRLWGGQAAQDQDDSSDEDEPGGGDATEREQRGAGP